MASVTDPATPGQHAEREHFFGGAKVMAALTLVSRILGMVRDMAITWLGATRTTDAFQVAFAIPNLFRRLFGEGALSASFVPVFMETAEKDGPAKAARLLANALGLLAVFLSGLLVAVLAGLLAWRAVAPGDANRQLLVGLLAVMMPFMVTVCLLALGSAALNCRGHFAYPAFAPILLNVFMIVAALGVAPRWRDNLQAKLFTIAASVALAGVVQLAGVLWLLRAAGFSVRPRLRPVEGGVRQMLRLMAPMLLGVGLLQISSLFDYLAAYILTATPESPTVNLLGWEVARPLSPGVLVRYNAANRLYQFPMGVLAISLGVAVFPLLSRYAARGDLPNLRDGLNRALRLAIMEGLATGAGLLLLGEPIVRLIFQHGKFTAGDSRQAAFILTMYVLGMWAYCSYQILARAFYSLKDTVTPLKVSCALVALYVVLVMVLVWAPQLGAGAFGAATATTASLNTLTLAWLLRRRLGRIGGRKLALSVARSATASAVMAAAVLALRWAFPAWADWKTVAVCVPAGAAAFLLTAWALRAPELGELFGALAKRAMKAPLAP